MLYNILSLIICRGNDLMLRIERKFSAKKMNHFLSILPIYRLQEDEIYYNINRVGVNGSNELTVNINYANNIKLNSNVAWKTQIGHPVLWREARPDGLTRFFVFSSGITAML